MNTPFFCFIAYALLVCVCYFDVFDWMIGRYLSADSYYSHGFLVPIVAGYLIWLKRQEFVARQSRTSWLGLALVVFASIVHLFGTVVYIFSISGFSLWLLIVGSCLFIYGWEKTRLLWFPIVFLLFMIPVPLAIINSIAFPLKFFVAHYGVWLVDLFGVPVYREGFNIVIPQGALLVGDPCSGLRSLLSFLAIGSLFTYLSNLSIRRKWILFLLIVPIALASNLIRVFILIFLSYKFGIEAAAPDTIVHNASGLLVFLLGGILLYFSMNFLKEIYET